MCYNSFSTKINLFKYKRFKIESVATKVLYRATLHPFLSYSAGYGNDRFFPYKSLNFVGYETVPTFLSID